MSKLKTNVKSRKLLDKHDDVTFAMVSIRSIEPVVVSDFGQLLGENLQDDSPLYGFVRRAFTHHLFLRNATEPSEEAFLLILYESMNATRYMLVDGDRFWWANVIYRELQTGMTVCTLAEPHFTATPSKGQINRYLGIV